jgi:hypothetical protein
MLSKHNKAFLGALQQMMVAVFGPGMEQAFSKAPVQGALWSWANQALSRHYGASQCSLLLRALEVKLSSRLRRPLGNTRFSLHCRPQEDSQSSHHRRAAQVNLCNSRIRTSPRTEIWHSARLGPRSLPVRGLLRRTTGCRETCTAGATMRWETMGHLTLSHTQDTRQLQARKKTTPWRGKWPN